MLELSLKRIQVIYDAFELKDGIASIKAESNITLEDFAKFLGKVKGINHSLHGIYNTFDKSMLSGKMWGEGYFNSVNGFVLISFVIGVNALVKLYMMNVLNLIEVVLTWI